MLHRAIFGSLERFFGVLIESTPRPTARPAPATIRTTATFTASPSTPPPRLLLLPSFAYRYRR